MASMWASNLSRKSISFLLNKLKNNYVRTLFVGSTNEMKLSKINFNVGAQTTIKKVHSSSNPEDNERPKMLMHFAPLVWPQFLQTIKNWTLIKLVIRPLLDPDFQYKEFVTGAKQALVYVSTQLAEGNFQALEGLVEDKAILEIKNSYGSLNMKQRQDLQVKLEEIIYCFIYQIGIIMADDSVKRFVEINVVYHCVRGFKDIDPETFNFNDMLQHKDKITICNYRFIREYTKGVHDNWMINRLNHFKSTQL